MILHKNYLQKKVQNRDLLSIRRAGICRHAEQGFLLDFSDTLLLFQHVVDFHLEGYLLLRRVDITELKSTHTDQFQRELLNAEGVLDQIAFDFRAPIESFEVFLQSCGKNEIVIVEDERADSPEFLLGSVERIGEGSVYMNVLSGTACWEKASYPLLLERITSCKIASNYIRFYERHLNRMACQD